MISQLDKDNRSISTAENDDIAIQKSQIQKSIAEGIAKKFQEKREK